MEHDFISMCKERTTDALDRFLHDLSFVPADKLTWRPAPTAKSALDIAAHCAGYSGAFASIIRAREFPPTVEEFRAPIQAAIESVATVEQARAMLMAGIAETVAALDTVRPEEIDMIVDAPHGSPPFKFFLTLPAKHLETHGAQIDFLQTCWGDLDVHVMTGR